MAASVGRVVSLMKPRKPMLFQRTCRYCTYRPGRVVGVWTQKIDHNLELRAIKQDGVVQHARPLMMVFGWMLAKRKHMQKYEDYYLNRGYNVLTVTASPIDILKPVRAQGIATKIIHHIEDRTQNIGRQPVLLHGFSVGGYLIAELHVKLNSENTIARELVAAQVLDSPVDIDGIPIGFSTSLTKNQALRFVIKKILHIYMEVFRASVAEFHKASEAFKYNKYRIPSLFLYSKADSVVAQDSVEGFIKGYNKRKVPVQSKCWHDSPHVSHYYYHPTEYIDKLTSFLDTYAPSTAHVKGHGSQKKK